MEKISFHQKIGISGEQIALNKLQEKGFKILHTRWHYGHYEIDIIAFYPPTQTLHFLEVKTRTNKLHGNPEEYVSKKKIKQMLESANFYLLQHTQYTRIQLDIIALIIHPVTLECIEFFMVEDIYDY